MSNNQVIFRSPSEAFRDAKQKGIEGENYLDNIFSKWYHISEATGPQQYQGIDRVFRAKKDGKQMTIEYKTDFASAKTKNAFFELRWIKGDVKEWREGWAVKLAADKVIYLCVGLGIFVLTKREINLHLLEWLDKYKTRESKTGDWIGVGIAVPVSVLKEHSEWYLDLRKGATAK